MAAINLTAFLKSIANAFLSDSATVTWSRNATSIFANAVATPPTPLPSGPAHEVIATPTGSSGISALRALVSADLPVGSSSQKGALQVDGTSITATSGTISAAPTALPTGSGNEVIATPSGGGSGVAALRALVSADLPVGSSSQKGAVQVDNTTITASAGVISAIPTALPSSTQNLFVATPNGSSGISSLRAIVPADLPVGSASQLGAVEVDGTTITASAGVISAVPQLKLIQKIVTSGSQTTVVFSGIPQTFNNLRLIGGFQAGSAGNIAMQFNGITAATYGWGFVYSTLGSGAGQGDSQFGQTSALCGSYAGTLIVDFPNYTAPIPYIHGSGTWGVYASQVYAGACMVANSSITTGLTSITMFVASNAFTNGSTFYLYGY